MSKPRTLKLTIPPTAHGKRIDKAIQSLQPTWSRSAIKAMLNARQIQVNNKKVWVASWEVKAGDIITILNPPQEKEADPFPKFNPAWVIQETEEYIAVNKPHGLLSHQTWDKQRNGLLELARQHYSPDVALFHRLDKDTSGVILLTRSHSFNQYLDHVFKEHLTQKEYLAVVPKPNDLKHAGDIKTNIIPMPNQYNKMMAVKTGGKFAHTRYVIEQETDTKQLVRLFLLTGRTHQLRVHMRHMHAPIYGDPIYGENQFRAPRLMLHAQRLILPATEERPKIIIETPNPFKIKE